MTGQLPLDEETLSAQSSVSLTGLCAFLSVTVLRVQSYLGYENNGPGHQHQGQILAG